MTTYVYQTIPSKPDEKVRYFEIRQAMTEAPLMRHPETDEPIRRVVLGGFGVLSSKTGSGSSDASCGCASGSCCS